MKIIEKQQQIEQSIKTEIEKRDIPLTEVSERCLIQYQGLNILRLIIDDEVVLELDTRTPTIRELLNG